MSKAVCHTEEEKQINTHGWICRGFSPRWYVPKHAESLSIKNTTLYGYTIMPSCFWKWKFLEESFHFPLQKGMFPARLSGWPKENTLVGARWGSSTLLNNTQNSWIMWHIENLNTGGQMCEPLLRINTRKLHAHRLICMHRVIYRIYHEIY